ncbi:MAG TPA: hypothetical protein VIL11_03315, partial [Limnochordales bacterium]
PYRRGLPVHVAASFLGRESGRLFNAMVVERFLSRVPLFPTGTTVRLNTGEVAVVVSQNPQDRRRPVVRLLAGRDGKVLRRPVEIDLLRDRERAIEGVQPWAPPGESP